MLTVHHWPDRARGLAELRRVARDRVVILTWEPDAASFWLVEEYFPELVAVDRAIFPTRDELEHSLGPVELRPLPVPHDCVDGFLGAYWRRPHAYLDPAVRGAISTFSKIGDVAAGLARLRSDLEDGTWTPAPRRRCWSAPSSISATAWSSPLPRTLSPQGRGQGEGPGGEGPGSEGPERTPARRATTGANASMSRSKTVRYEMPYRSRRCRTVSQISSTVPTST